MNKRKTLYILLSLCIILSGCAGKNPEKVQTTPEPENSISFIDIRLGDAFLEDWHENNVITTVRWNKLKLGDSCIEEYPALSAAFEKHNEESFTEAKALMYEFIPFAKEMEGDEFNPSYCRAESKAHLQRADNNIISLLEITEKYTGGIHPDYFITGRNFNTQTGETVRLTEVLTDVDALPSILEKKITERYPGVAFSDLEYLFSEYKPDEFTWTVDYQGITFWFSPYDIAAYSVGTLSARLWFDEIPDMFDKKLTQAPENYVTALPVGYDFEFDLSEADGIRDSVYTEKIADQYGSYNMLSVTVNGKTGIDEINYAYDFDVYLAHLGNKNYIYSDSSSDNDYHMFCTWDINGEKPEKIDELYSTEIDYEYVEEGFEEGTVYTQTFNNPDSLRLEKRFDILGTRGGTAGFKLNKEDGRLIMTDDAYTFNYGHDLKTKIPLDAELLPGKEKTQLPYGTLLLPYRTDGKSFIDLKTENGAVVRILIDASAFPVTVNGLPEDECFENLLYAG